VEAVGSVNKEGGRSTAGEQVSHPLCDGAGGSGACHQHVSLAVQQLIEHLCQRVIELIGKSGYGLRFHLDNFTGPVDKHPLSSALHVVLAPSRSQSAVS
jgi:hypothetical protein